MYNVPLPHHHEHVTMLVVRSIITEHSDFSISKARCFPPDGCVHGECINPDECSCSHGWDGYACDEGMIIY